MLSDLWVNKAYSILQCQMSNNREAVVKPWSRYSRKTSGNIFSLRSVLQKVYTG